eukprot:Sspe_Gene.13612::Locus_4667_Transcript_1_2_Confidence_0.750_Length_1254::g.13612::m.13612
MGCGASSEGANSQKLHVEQSRNDVRREESDLDDKKPQKAPAPPPFAITPVETEVVEFTEPGTNHVLRFFVTDGMMQYEVDGKLRCPLLKKLHFDDYFCFLRFPDTGKGGKLARDPATLPKTLGGLKHLASISSCTATIPNDVHIEMDIPGGFQRNQRVKAAKDIYVTVHDELAVKKMDLGSVVGPSSDGRLYVKWDQRRDGKQKRISVLPDEVKLTSDIAGGLLRGQAVFTADEATIQEGTPPPKGATLGVIHGPSPTSPSTHVVVLWDGKDEFEEAPQDTLALVHNDGRVRR